MAYTILVQEDNLYLISIVSEMNYNKMLGKLPDGYILFDGTKYNSFRYIGKALPPMLINDTETTLELLNSEWVDLLGLKTKYSISATDPGLSLT